MIITDHHECRNQALPGAVAVVDPKREGCPYPNKELAGVGVALKLPAPPDGDCGRAVQKYATLWRWAPWPTSCPSRAKTATL
jgi:single-stranded-DNA-specific exonuclease